MQHRFSIPFVGGWTTVMESEEFNKKKEKIKHSVREYVQGLEKSLVKNPGRALLICAGWGLGSGIVAGVLIKAAALTGVVKAAAVVGSMTFSGVTGPIIAAKVNDWCDCTDELRVYVAHDGHQVIDAA